MKITKEAKVGTLVVVALTILYTGFNFLKGKDYFSNDNTYYILYDQIDGLQKSNPIVVNGFTVGRVDEIRLLQDKNDSLLVIISVSTDIEMPQGTTALLTDDGLLGGKKISLQLGKSTTVLQNESYIEGLKDGGFAEAIAEKATPVIANLDKTLVSFNGILSDSSKTGLKNSLVALNSTIKSIDVLANEANSLVRKNKPVITDVMKSLDSSMVAFKNTMKSLEPLVAKLDHFADSLNNMELKQTVAEAKNTMASFRLMADNINEGKGTLGKLMTDEQVFNNLNMATQRLNLILYNFDTDPKQYLAPLGQSQKKIMKKRAENSKVSGHYKEFKD